MKIGKYEVTKGTCNANGEMTQMTLNGSLVKGSELPDEVRDFFRNAPRVKASRSNGSPFVELDGETVLLGYWAQNKGERDSYNSTRSGGSSSGTKTTLALEAREELLNFAGTLTGKDKTALLAIIDKVLPDPEIMALRKKIVGLFPNLSDEEINELVSKARG